MPHAGKYDPDWKSGTPVEMVDPQTDSQYTVYPSCPPETYPPGYFGWAAHPLEPIKTEDPMTTKSPPIKKIPIDPAIEPLLHQLTWFEYGGQTAVRITQQLDRPTYEAVNKVLEALGGQWNRKAKGHLFPQNPRPELEAALGNGVVIVEKDGFFPTPKDVIGNGQAVTPSHSYTHFRTLGRGRGYL